MPDTIATLDGYQLSQTPPNPRSPWGRQTEPPYQLRVAGLYTIRTASHGGIWVSPTRLHELPQWCREYAKRWSKGNGPQWFEEDCAALLVILAWPEAFAWKNPEQQAEVLPRIGRDVCSFMERNQTMADQETVRAWCRARASRSTW